PSGNAGKAGIQPGDILKKIDGIAITSISQAQEHLSWKRFPQLIELEIERNFQVKKILICTKKRPYIPVEEVFEKDIERKIITLIFGLELDYYAKKMLTKKYVIKKVYKGMPGFQFDLGEGDPIVVHDLRYNPERHTVVFIFRYMKKELGITERGIGLELNAEINTIL
ncbi:MAG: PDZ domain-containing protein, partial [Spirochaetes bacterium]|nr:PDZ domain-containing protein [Spirochaetota bacterium]